MINESQKRTVLEIWNTYSADSRTCEIGSEKLTYEELNERRLTIIPQIKRLLSDYLTGTIPLEQMKSENDGINKQNLLWGFRGMNGQMYFNMLYNFCSGLSLLDELNSVLKQCIPAPKSLDDARSKILVLAEFSSRLGDNAPDKRKAPRTGSCLFFISYFWQIQDHDKWPVYYSSMVNVLMGQSLWTPSCDHPADYAAFYELNREIQSLIQKQNGTHISYWDIEHALWGWREQLAVLPPTGESESRAQEIHAELPSSFVPPVVSILAALAKNDPIVEAACKKAGVSVEKTFEDRISLLFKIMGFFVEPLGQGYGRVPDGIAICQEFRYAIIFDAKVRSGKYTVGTDDRAIKEYISREVDRLRRQGIRNVYFAVISSSFSDDFDTVIRNLKIETEIREVLFIEAAALVTLLDQKLRNPELDLGPNGVQGLLAQSAIITDAEMKDLLA